MRLTFDRPYISITSAVTSPDTEIANFVVLSGPNGSGKSHLLQAIQQGAVRVDDIPTMPQGPLATIRLFSLAQLAPPQEADQNSLLSKAGGSNFVNKSSN